MIAPGAEAATTAAPPAERADRARLRRALRALRRNPRAAAGIVILLAVAIVAIDPHLFMPYQAGQQVGPVYGAPGLSHPFGLDDAGHDVLSETLLGTQATLLIAVTSALIAVGIGAVVGIAAGYAGGWLDLVLMRLTDYVLVIPVLPLAIVAAALFGAGLANLILVIGLLLWTTTARAVRAQVMSLRSRVFVRRVRSLGASNLRIVLRHILPQLAPLLVAMAAIDLAVAIFTQSALAFFGLGNPNQITWGIMIWFAFERTALVVGAWWAFVAPGLAIMLVAMSGYWVGQAIEDALNPRLRVRHLAPRSFRVALAGGAAIGTAPAGTAAATDGGVREGGR
jgi:peptide/nickel transport system permease protein